MALSSSNNLTVLNNGKFDCALIDKYMQCIEEIVDRSLSTNTLYQPESILRQLLTVYRRGRWHLPGVSLIFEVTRANENFAQTLLNALESNNFHWLSLLNDYLGQNKLNKKGDFFSLFIAYFLYYRNAYTDFTPYKNIVTQIIIPLHIYKTDQQISDIQYCLDLLDSGNPELVAAACQQLGKLPIPQKMLTSAVKALLLMTEKDEYASGKVGVCHYRYFQYALEVLSKINIPNEMVDAVLDRLIVIMNWTGSRHESRNCKELYAVLDRINIPAARLNGIIDCLYLQAADHYDWAINSAVWKLLKKLDRKNTRTIEFIDSKMNEIKMELSNIYYPDFNRAQKVNGLISSLATCFIPEEKKSAVIRQIFAVIDKIGIGIGMLARPNPPNYFLMCTACLVLKNCAPIMDPAFNAWVLEKVLDLLSAYPGSIYEAFDVLTMLHLPKAFQIRMSAVLMDAVRRRATGITLDYSNALNCAKKLALPADFRSQFIEELIKNIKNDAIKLQGDAYITLAQLGIPAPELEPIITLMLKRLNDPSRNSWEPGEKILAAFKKMHIPAGLQDQVQQTLVSYTLKQIESSNLLLNSCEIIGRLTNGNDTKVSLLKSLLNALAAARVHPDRLEGVFTCMYDLVKGMCVLDTIELKIHIGSIKSKEKDPVCMLSLTAFQYKLENLMAQQQLLTVYQLPLEVAQHVLSFIRYTD